HDSDDIDIIGNVINNNYDDCVALNAKQGASGAGLVYPKNIDIVDNNLEEHPWSGFGDVLGSCVYVRGAQDISVKNNDCAGGESSIVRGSISIYNEGTMFAKSIDVESNKIKDAGGCGVFVTGGDTGTSGTSSD